MEKVGDTTSPDGHVGIERMDEIERPLGESYVLTGWKVSSSAASGGDIAVDLRKGRWLTTIITAHSSLVSF